MRLTRRRAPLTTALVAALALGPLAAVPAVAAPVADPSGTTASSTTTTAATTTAATVAISGELAVGRTVKAVSTGWPEGAVLTHEWLADDGTTVLATTPSLLLTTSHATQILQVRVTGQVPGAAPTTVVTTNTLRVAQTSRPTLSGRTEVGATLTATPGTWTTGTTLTYQWLADGVPVTGATRSTFVPTAAQSGRSIAVAVTGAKAGYQTLTRVSAASRYRVMSWATPTIAGTVAYGSTLTARPGSWTTGATFAYQWYASGSAITGATRSTLKLGTEQKGRSITVRVTGSKDGHTRVAKRSVATARVITAGTPTISGTPVAGSTLSAKAGSWTTGTTKSYRWYADGVAISGATGTTLTVTSTLKDKRIQVRVTGRKDGYATVTKASASTQRVQVAPRPTISGTPKVTYTLTARRGTSWSSGTSFTYQWYADGRAISGATYSTLKLSAGRVGQTIKVKVTGRKSGYPTVSRTSAATAAVTYPLRTTPIDTWNCPSWAPIKGNADSMIYHLPSGAYYTRTNPEECFRTETAAVNAGYRRSKV